MPTTPVYDATRQNFTDLVLGNSAKGLVLVHYWTPKAAPCALLTPRLVQLAEHYAGRFLLVLANTDELGAIARGQGVTSVPTVKFYLHGEVVHTIHGAESDSTFRTALSRFLAGDDDRLRQAALRAHHEGRGDEAISLLARAAVEHPDNLDITADLAKLLTLEGQSRQGLNLLAALPREARCDGRIAPLLAHLELLAAAEDSVDEPAAEVTDGPGVRLGRAARALLADDMEQALDGLLALALENPAYRDDIGRRALLAVFAMLGPEHELTRRYRARLAAASA